ncbi:tetratricopeptide repeat protein [uncultured Winogradskyella sp.]|uniref:tetratricopeptide repeat protein n=1 Tax=uncultured Winogradskyella sp. TaxID=395353 RepID=UPI00261F3417|nr:tetratricopeptide repeat protein [uncultured Winogradskyella sp.]
MGFKKGKARALYIKGLAQSEESDFDRGFEFMEKALQLYKTINYKAGISECYDGMGLILNNKGETKEAITYYLKSARVNEAIGNKEGVAADYISIGVAYYEIGDYNEALNQYKKALQINKEINNDEGIARCLINIGNIHIVKGNFPLAIEYQHKSLEINEKRKDTTLISFSLNNLGVIYNSLGNHEKAIPFVKQALEIQKKSGDKKRIAETLNNLGALYINIKNYEEAHKYLKEALHLCQDINNKFIEGNTLNNIGSVFLYKKNYYNSLEYYEKASIINLNIGNKRALLTTYFGLARVYANLKKNAEALTYALKSKRLSQDFKLVEMERHIHELLVKIYKSNRNYKKALENHEQYKILSDSIFNKTNLEKIAQLEAEYKYRQALDSANIRELKLTKTVAATSQDLEKTQRNYLWAIIGVLLLSILLGAIVFYQKLKNAKSKTQNAIMEQKLLRSQMTPHFIFNSLSVLQGMILNKEEKKSVHYLSKFSKLLRITLENSRDKTVLLSQELTAVQDYLALQTLENDAYKCTILVEDSIDVPTFEIPPMLIQPFVENAIEHAFVNQSEDKKIDIRLMYKNKKLICNIADNGVGINSKRETNNKNKNSLATTITSERLKVLSKDFNMEGSVTIEDREKHNEQGTLVTLVIPYKINVE